MDTPPVRRIPHAIDDASTRSTKVQGPIQQAIDFAFNTVEKGIKGMYEQLDEVYNAVVYYTHKYMLRTTDDKPGLDYQYCIEKQAQCHSAMANLLSVFCLEIYNIQAPLISTGNGVAVCVVEYNGEYLVVDPLND